MISENKNDAKLDAAFAVLERTALAGERCPMNGYHGITAEAVTALAREQRIFVEIWTHNYRQVTILAGPNKGKQTKRAPYGRIWKTVGLDTRINGKSISYATRTIRKAAADEAVMRQPSAPRLLPRAYFKGR